MACGFVIPAITGTCVFIIMYRIFEPVTLSTDLETILNNDLIVGRLLLTSESMNLMYRENIIVRACFPCDNSSTIQQWVYFGISNMIRIFTFHVLQSWAK